MNQKYNVWNFLPHIENIPDCCKNCGKYNKESACWCILPSREKITF